MLKDKGFEKKAVVAQFNGLSLYFPGDTEKNRRKSQSGEWLSWKRLGQGSLNN
jgi:hypothetical protein